ncbi:DNA-binding protein [Candidatus Roizmanbacteria bacterium]|nr:DNA-binding protein [Candidatus Roizmanbacteria bacterium]
MKTHVFRLRPGQNFREEIDKYVREHNIRAGIILTCVGNLTKAILRMANAKIIKTWEGSFEIISVVGTVETGNSHIHICLSDEDGKTFGGHLKDGSVVGVTAEVAIGEIEDLEFSREFDQKSGYNELVVKSKKIK